MERTARTRLIAAQTVSVLLIVVTVATAVVALHFATDNADDAIELADDVALARRLTSEAQHFAATGRRYILTSDPLDRKRTIELEGELDRTREQLAARGTHAEAEIAAVETALNAYVSTMAWALTEAGADPEELRERLVRLEAELAMKRRSLDVGLEAFVRHQRGGFAASHERSHRFAGRATRMLLVISALSIVLSVGLAIAVMRQHARQIRRIRAASEIAKRASDSRQELLASSHDLRTPLQAITATAASLEKLKPRDAAELQALDEISTAATRVDQLLEALFDVSRIQTAAVSLRREQSDAESLVERAIQPFHARAKERAIRLRSEARSSTSVYADRERIGHVLTTLIGTALKPARPGAEIIVSAAPAEDVVRFAVVDSGTGALPEPLSQMFGRHTQFGTEAPDLGLYVCKRLVEAHGGRLGVEVEPGRGNTYWFTLPTEPRLLR